MRIEELDVLIVLTMNFGSRINIIDNIIDPTFDQHGLFDKKGGYFKRFNSNAEQFEITLRNLSLSSLAPQYRRSPLKTVSGFMKREWTCGLPGFDPDEVLTEIKSARNMEPISTSNESTVHRKELEHLAYL